MVKFADLYEPSAQLGYQSEKSDSLEALNSEGSGKGCRYKVVHSGKWLCIAFLYRRCSSKCAASMSIIQT